MIDQSIAPMQEQPPAEQECCELYGEYCYPCQKREPKEQSDNRH